MQAGYFTCPAAEGRHCSDTPAVTLASDCIDKFDDRVIGGYGPRARLGFLLQVFELDRARSPPW
ncbi:hypothetical protein SynA1825c_00940 [Synechococcus sp. A18-25c]|nr:hypothetical protein SynA1560_00950 [Synechococcus sp. A15-60]QNJ19256.1 hypothetical protein SynA1825c_00940 [Synechococcus sp. A18-25c]